MLFFLSSNDLVKGPYLFKMFLLKSTNLCHVNSAVAAPMWNKPKEEIYFL